LQSHKQFFFKVLFQLSKYDNIQFTESKNFQEIQTNNEEECAMYCLQSNFCDHFVYRPLDPTKVSQKNCNLAKNNYENLVDCRLDSICANLASCKLFLFFKNCSSNNLIKTLKMKDEKNIKNNSVSISILPNVTYRFRIQLKDKIHNWTNLEETKQINCNILFDLFKYLNDIFSK
jgi:hypothetical protein